jgi:hypothetical protein
MDSMALQKHSTQKNTPPTKTPQKKKEKTHYIQIPDSPKEKKPEPFLGGELDVAPQNLFAILPHIVIDDTWDPSNEQWSGMWGSEKEKERDG